jgi:glucose-6-phosphate isomerase
MQFALNLYHHRTVLGMQTRAVLPYTSALGKFPAYLQQLIMESLGKSVTHSGEVTDECGIMVFGEPGTNAQHSFMQYLHQSPQIVPVDFIVILDANPKSAHGLLVNAIAQANALAIGKSATDLNLEGVPEDLIPHQVMQGNRPSSVIAIKDLSAVSIGQLIAFYENVVSILGILWGINAYDQWGVELGKEMSANLINSINARNLDNLDESTKWILQKYLDAN